MNTLLPIPDDVPTMPDIGARVTYRSGTITRLSETQFRTVCPPLSAFTSKDGGLANVAYLVALNIIRRRHHLDALDVPCCACGVQPRWGALARCHDCHNAQKRKWWRHTANKPKAERKPRHPSNELFFDTLSHDDLMARLQAAHPEPPPPDYEAVDTTRHAEPMKMTQARQFVDALIARRTAAS